MRLFLPIFAFSAFFAVELLAGPVKKYHAVTVVKPAALLTQSTILLKTNSIDITISFPITVYLQSSTNLTDWSDCAIISMPSALTNIPANSAQMFFRAVTRDNWHGATISTNTP